MSKFFDRIRNIEKGVWVKNSFLLPILLVVIISISHVVSWYDLGNPTAWAIYLSIAIEIFALASVSAASSRETNRVSVWFLFSVVTSIQIIGNIFFSYKEIDIKDPNFLAWVELISPLFNEWTIMDHRRLEAALLGGLLPIMSLTALHFYIKASDRLAKEREKNEEKIVEEIKEQETKEPLQPRSAYKGFWSVPPEKKEEEEPIDEIAEDLIHPDDLDNEFEVSPEKIFDVEINREAASKPIEPIHPEQRGEQMTFSRPPENNNTN